MTYDVAIVGSGIVGLAHAWRAAVRGKSVLVLERSREPRGASIRNFGLICPVCQPLGERYDLASLSRSLWLELATVAGIWVHECGSLHLAHREDEWAVLQEFCDHSTSRRRVQLCSPEWISDKTPAANPHGLLGGLWSSEELCVNPRLALGQMARFFSDRVGIDLHSNATVIAVDGREIRTSDGRKWQANLTLVCSGADFETLYPREFGESGIRRVELQMFRTRVQRGGWQLNTHLSSGLSLLHHQSFAECPSLANLRQRVLAETPELDQFGIHVMASQNDAGNVILGDSHECDDSTEPFYRQDIEDLVMRELRKRFILPDWTIESRWRGCYAQHPTKPLLRLQPSENVFVCISPGGSGMTLSLGWADIFWNQWA